jgi:hypothetical protein
MNRRAKLTPATHERMLHAGFATVEEYDAVKVRYDETRRLMLEHDAKLKPSHQRKHTTSLHGTKCLFCGHNLDSGQSFCADDECERLYNEAKEHE